jgi:hypothetical protein
MDVIARPPFQLRSLPIPMRWEVTRRNPYYYVWWKLAKAEHRGEVIASPEDALLRQAAIPILGMIGVSGEPPDPATLFSELGADDLERGWRSGAVHPVTMRGLAAILLAALPKETLAPLGRLFLSAACEDVEDQPPRDIEAMQRLMTDACPGLDNYPDEPIVSINPAASERKIGEAINLLLREWKNQRELTERRDRSEKHEEYLEVWDLREGWRNGLYERRDELTLLEIAEITKRSLSTLNNQYCRAFDLIVGRPYSRELWFQLFGAIKLSDLIGAGVPRTRRPLTSPTPRPVPESVVSPVSDDATSRTTTVVGCVEAGDDAGYLLLLNDIASMIERARSDEQISAELDLPADVVSYLRDRGDMSSLRP